MLVVEHHEDIHPNETGYVQTDDEAGAILKLLTSSGFAFGRGSVT